MLSIVAVHSTGVFWLTKLGSDFGDAIVTPFKFGTIGFFLISGFLLGERVDRRNPVDYFLRRLKRVFVPWLFWSIMMCAVLVIKGPAGHGPEYANWSEVLHSVNSNLRFTLFRTAFWFVPNLLLCIAVLLAFRRHIYSLKLGFVLLALNLVYVVNIYMLWFPSLHSQALFGFVFYLWLGSYAAQNFERISNVLNRIPAAAFVAASLITAVAAFGESHLLAGLKSPDALNTLRLSNQLFSIFIVLMIFKFTRASWPRFIDVRQHTFGLYLSHAIVLLLLMHLLRHAPLLTPSSVFAGDVEGVLLWIAVSVLAYICCLLVTIWLASQPSLQWMVGLAPQDLPRQPDLDITDARGLLASR